MPPAPGSSSDWWPGDLHAPNSTGAQNGVRYAYFAQPRRLAIDVGGTVTVYDTLNHQIGGFSQQQSVGGTLSFSSQHGLIDVASLPVVSPGGQPAPEKASPAPPSSTPTTAAATPPTTGQPESLWQAPAQAASTTDRARDLAPASTPAAGRDQDVFAMIERLADLRSKGILSEEEFAAKKTELLSRI